MQPAEHVTIDTPEQIALGCKWLESGASSSPSPWTLCLQVILYITVFLVLLARAGRRIFCAVDWQASPVPAVAILVWLLRLLGLLRRRVRNLVERANAGKRLAGIRVIKETGRPINAFEAIGRNVCAPSTFFQRHTQPDSSA